MVAVEAGQAMWIDLLYFMAWIKLAVSLIKYLPQVRHTPKTLVHMLWAFDLQSTLLAPGVDKL